MNLSRRQTLQTAGSLGLYGALAAIGLVPAAALAQGQAFDANAFQARTMADAIKALGAGAPAESKDVVINSPDIAENGAVVPVGIRSAIPNTDFMALLVDKNPNALAGAYRILEGAEADVNMRIKMGQSSDVVAIVRANGKYYMAKKEIKVTLGGCGG
jgi:sulfur-oxidizing protein SoxY